MVRTRRPLRRNRGTRLRRGAQLLEFLLVLPLMLFVMLFTVDMGRLALAHSAVTEAAFSAARQGGQAGRTSDSTAAATAHEVLIHAPVVDADQATTTVLPGRRVCSSSNVYVQVRVSTEVGMLTPGLGRLVGMVVADDWAVAATGTARCEIARQ